jgi:metal iron transporter
MLVAIIVGREGINELLVASQVVLSFVLPFVAFPLVYITSSSELMRSRRDDASSSLGRALVSGRSGAGVVDDAASDTSSKSSDAMVDSERAEETKDYSNGKVVMCIGYAIWAVVVVANAYVLVTLAMGEE